jgi:TrmH family RNA methyltransferase
VPLLGVRSGRVAAARRLLRRSARRETGRFLIEGPQALPAAVERIPLLEVFATPEAVDRQPALLGRIRATGAPLRLIERAAAAALSETVTPQGLVAVATIPLGKLEELTRPRLVAVLVEPRDPGNVGTIIRTADAAGADAVILSGDSVDPFGGKAVRASAGSVFHLPVIDGVPTSDAMSALAGLGCRLLAADGHADRDLDEALDNGLLDGPTAWLFGNEAHGLTPEVIDSVAAAAGTPLRVPVYGAAESLNLGAAAAVCLYASARAQRNHRGEGVGE